MTNNRCVIIFIVCIATLLLCGCGNNSKANSGKKPAESTPVSDLELYSDSEQDTADLLPIKVLEYDYSDAGGFSDCFEIRLFSDGSFQYLTSFTGSLIVSGMWDVKYGVLCLQDNSSERDTGAVYNIITNCLCIDGGKVTYLKDYSCGFSGIELEDGAEFKDTDPESGELTDVLFALQKDFGGGRHVNRNPFDYLEDDRSFLGEWICEKSEETVMISMADVQVGGYHFEIKKGDQRVGYGDAYNSDHKLICTQAYYNDDIMDGVIVGTDNGLSFGVGVTGEDEKGTYVGDGVMELVWKSMSGSESSEPRRDSRRVIVKPEVVEIDFTYAGAEGKMTADITKGALSEGDSIKVILEDAEGKAVYETELGKPHVGWNAFYIYNHDGQDYLISYIPVGTAQGVVYASFRMYEFDSEGNEILTAEYEIHSAGEISDFNKNVIEYMEQSRLLISTLDGKVTTEIL